MEILCNPTGIPLKFHMQPFWNPIESHRKTLDILWNYDGHADVLWLLSFSWMYHTICCITFPGYHITSQSFEIRKNRWKTPKNTHPHSVPHSFFGVHVNDDDIGAMDKLVDRSIELVQPWSTMDGCEILHHLGWSDPTNNGWNHHFQRVQDFASIHSMIEGTQVRPSLRRIHSIKFMLSKSSKNWEFGWVQR